MTEKTLIVTGKVIAGDSLGRTIGFPTANLDKVPATNKLKTGVYTGKCIIKSTEYIKYDCLIYFGPRYIAGRNQNSFEVYIFNFEGDLYDQILEVSIGAFIRSPMKFSNLQDLKTQLQKDREHGMVILAHEKQI